MSLPLSLLFGSWTTFLDSNGDPLNAGTLNFSLAGLSTPSAVFADSDGNTSLGAIVTLNAAGRPSSSGNPTGVYLAPHGYKCTIKDSNGATVVVQDDIMDIGQVFIATQANTFTEGQKNAPSNYTATNDDYLITASGTPILLQAAADRGTQIIIKNVSASPCVVTPSGAETIDNVAGGFTLPAASSPTFPSILLYSDGVSGYFIAASHGI